MEQKDTKMTAVHSFLGVSNSDPNINGKPCETGRTYKAEKSIGGGYAAFIACEYPPLCLNSHEPHKTDYYVVTQDDIIRNEHGVVASNTIVLNGNVSGTDMAKAAVGYTTANALKKVNQYSPDYENSSLRKRADITIHRQRMPFISGERKRDGVHIDRAEQYVLCRGHPLCGYNNRQAWCVRCQ